MSPTPDRILGEVVGEPLGRPARELAGTLFLAIWLERREVDPDQELPSMSEGPSGATGRAVL